MKLKVFRKFNVSKEEYEDIGRALAFIRVLHRRLALNAMNGRVYVKWLDRVRGYGPKSWGANVEKLRCDLEDDYTLAFDPRQITMREECPFYGVKADHFDEEAEQLFDKIGLLVDKKKAESKASKTSLKAV